MYFLYISYINESTNFAESLGGSGDTKDWGHRMDKTMFATGNEDGEANNKRRLRR